MEKLLVKGGNKLRGEVTISGAKNAAVAILPACLLVKGNCRIENLPDIKDVKLFLRILEQLNADVKYIDKNTVDIDCTNVDSYRPLGELTRKMRGSSYLMGALLGRFSNFIFDPPGGCDFGTRPIDQHIKAFKTSLRYSSAYSTISRHSALMAASFEGALTARSISSMESVMLPSSSVYTVTRNTILLTSTAFSLLQSEPSVRAHHCPSEHLCARPGT